MSKNFKAFLNLDLSDNRKFKPGDYVVFMDGKVFQKGVDIERMLKEAKTKFPKKTPFVTIVPEPRMMVLFFF